MRRHKSTAAAAAAAAGRRRRLEHVSCWHDLALVTLFAVKICPKRPQHKCQFIFLAPKLSRDAVTGERLRESFAASQRVASAASHRSPHPPKIDYASLSQNLVFLASHSLIA
eukprot:7267475-Prymnesium_polylepis.1